LRFAIWGFSIFHLSFVIYHFACHFNRGLLTAAPLTMAFRRSRNLALQMTNDKWKMENGKWRIAK
jgi:hypothetical protein